MNVDDRLRASAVVSAGTANFHMSMSRPYVVNAPYIKYSVSEVNSTMQDASTTIPLATRASWDLSGPALRAFFGIASQWELTNAQQRVLLGNPPPSTFFKWKKDQAGSLSRDVLERISYVLGIYKALQILFPDAQHADQWIAKPNSAELFGGASALDRMLAGNVSDLFVVRQYLDAQRGW